MSDLQSSAEAIKLAVIKALEGNTQSLGGDYWNSGEEGVAECFYDNVADEATAEILKIVEPR